MYFVFLLPMTAWNRWFQWNDDLILRKTKIQVGWVVVGVGLDDLYRVFMDDVSWMNNVKTMCKEWAI